MQGMAEDSPFSNASWVGDSVPAVAACVRGLREGRCLRSPHYLPVAVGSTHTSHTGAGTGEEFSCVWSLSIPLPPHVSYLNRARSSTLGSSSVMGLGSRRGTFRPGVHE